MESKEYIEDYIHPRDTGGYLIYDVHCYYCREKLHDRSKLPRPIEPFKDITKYN